MLAMGPRDLNSAPYSPVHCSSHSMTSFQSSELTEFPVVENSQLFAQRGHSARSAPRARRASRGTGVGAAPRNGRVAQRHHVRPAGPRRQVWCTTAVSLGCRQAAPACVCVCVGGRAGAGGGVIAGLRDAPRKRRVTRTPGLVGIGGGMKVEAQHPASTTASSFRLAGDRGRPSASGPLSAGVACPARGSIFFFVFFLFSFVFFDQRGQFIMCQEPLWATRGSISSPEGQASCAITTERTRPFPVRIGYGTCRRQHKTCAEVLLIRRTTGGFVAPPRPSVRTRRVQEEGALRCGGRGTATGLRRRRDGPLPSQRARGWTTGDISPSFVAARPFAGPATSRGARVRGRRRRDRSAWRARGGGSTA